GQRDLSDQEMELITRARDRLQSLTSQITPLKEARRISSESANEVAELHRLFNEHKPEKTQEVAYRSAGAYILDYWKAGLGAQEAAERLELFNRAAAHQTTGDNPVLLPSQMLEPVIHFVDASPPP